jgi:hypothetical protein
MEGSQHLNLAWKTTLKTLKLQKNDMKIRSHKTLTDPNKTTWQGILVFLPAVKIKMTELT